MMSLSLRLALLVAVIAAAPGAAQDRDRLDAVAAAVDRATAPPAAEAAALERMATFLATTPEALRAARAGTRFGWGDVFLSHRIAARGGHPVEKVFAARRTGAAWGEIAAEARVEVDTLVQDVAALWPDAARATPAGGAARTDPPPAPPSDARPATSAAPEEKKGLGGRVLDFLRGSPGDRADERARDKPIDRPQQDEIRDRMIRGGGRSR